MTKTCVLCNRKYTAKAPSQKICSNCARRICVGCHKEFYVYGGIKRHQKAKYCTLGCYLNHRWKANKCKECGRPSDTRYCSDLCRKAFWNKNDYVLRRRRQKFHEKKLEIFRNLGNRCKRCHNKDIRVLDVHHINSTWKRKPKDIRRTYTWSFRLKEWKENMSNLQLLCANCHRIVTWEKRDLAQNTSKSPNNDSAKPK